MKRKVTIDQALLTLVEQEISANVRLKREILQDECRKKLQDELIQKWESPYYCDICDSLFSSNYVLQRHNKTNQRHQALVLAKSKGINL